MVLKSKRLVESGDEQKMILRGVLKGIVGGSIIFSGGTTLLNNLAYNEYNFFLEVIGYIFGFTLLIYGAYMILGGIIALFSSKKILFGARHEIQIKYSGLMYHNDFYHFLEEFG